MCMSVCKQKSLLDIQEVCVSLSLYVTRADPERAGEMLFPSRTLLFVSDEDF